jgi:predicted esterase
MTNAPIRVNATPDGLALDRAALAAALRRLPAGAPVVVMIHGYRFAPSAPNNNCPHGHIFALDPPKGDAKAISWPRHLGLDGQRGLAVGFGWSARGSLPGAVRLARALGPRLAELAALIETLDPGRRIDVIGHSLGAKVALSALPHARPGLFRRLILLAAAETRRPALAALSSPAGRRVEVFNITTRENDIFDFLYEILASFGLDTAVGFGLGKARGNWLDLQIDQPASLGVLAALGHTLPQASARISHWSPYLRPGTFPLYRAVIDGRLKMATLRRALPDKPDQRWTRLLGRSGLALHPPVTSGIGLVHRAHESEQNAV